MYACNFYISSTSLLMKWKVNKGASCLVCIGILKTWQVCENLLSIHNYRCMFCNKSRYNSVGWNYQIDWNVTNSSSKKSLCAFPIGILITKWLTFLKKFSTHKLQYLKIISYDVIHTIMFCSSYIFVFWFLVFWSL